MSSKLVGLLIMLCATLLVSCHQETPAISITDQWVRASAEGQDVGAAYMTITSKSETSLVKIDSSIAEIVEIHQMSIENGVMKMRMAQELDLKANTPSHLAPGGYHLMLFDLKKPLKAGDEVQFSLHFKDKLNKETVVTVNSPVKTEQP
jgi:copper(I)-binding protein